MRYSEMKALENERDWRAARATDEVDGGAGELRASRIVAGICLVIFALALI